MTQRPLAPDPDEELVPVDDTVIGTALRRSAVVLAVLAVVVAAIVFLRRDAAEEETIHEKEVGHIADLVPDAEVLPTVRFTDVAQEAGIDFVHFTGARGEKLLPETMGGGAAFFDYDGDGDQDLLFVNGAPWPHDDGGSPSPGHRLYANDGTGHFTEVTAGSGLEARFYGMGAAVADYDGDGRVDVFMTAVGRNHLFRNTAAGFVDVTEAAGVGGAHDQWTTSAGFFDCDLDGDLDLFVCRYVGWTPEIDARLAFTLNGTDRAYGPPMNYEGTFSTLFLNDGDGTFTDVSAEAGIQVVNSATGAPMGKAMAVSFADFDADGLLDIVVANDTVQNHLFHNEGGARFTEVGMASGLGFDGNGKATGAMGIDVGDFRSDGGFGVGIGNFANEMTSLFVCSGAGMQFSDDAIGEGIGSPSRLHLSFGLFFFDYDLDGRLDLLQVNGHLEETISEVQASQHYRQPPQLFWNAGPDGRTCFREVPGGAAGDLDRRLVGRGSCFADIDGDGDLDALLVQLGDRPLLLRNEQELGHHWLRVRLVGRAPNRDAIGARLVLRAGGETLRRMVMPTKSYLSQSELPVTFGLGVASKVDALEITWPDGTVQAVTPPTNVDRVFEVRQ